MDVLNIYGNFFIYLVLKYIKIDDKYIYKEKFYKFFV